MNKYINPRIRLLGSLLTGLMVAYGVGKYLQQAERRLNSRYETTTVLIARKYLPMGKEVDPNLVEEKEIPVAFIQPTALNHLTDLKDPQGKLFFKIRTPLLMGEQVTRSKLMEEGGFLTLAWTLPPDQTAIGLKLNPEQAVGGHLKPGDWVSVFSTFDPQPGVPEAETVQILTRAQVVAVQDHLWEPSGGSSEKFDWKSLSNDLILVTLSVRFKEAGRLVLAADKGRVWLSLLSALDSSAADPIRVKLSQALKAQGGIDQ